MKREKFCEECGTITTNEHYCSRSCAAKAQANKPKQPKSGSRGRLTQFFTDAD